MKDESVHWADQIAQKIITDRGDKDEYTVAAGISPSGTVHFGNFREIITNELVAKGLKSKGKKVRFIYSWDDFDALRKVPKDMPNRDLLKENLRRPLSMVPDPFDCEHESYADHNESLLEEEMPRVGISPEYIYQNEKYMNCDYAEGTKTALDNADTIRDILNEFRTEPLDDDWLPISVYCDDCWKDTTEVVEYDGEYGVSFECKCGHEDEIDLREDGQYKLLWRADWPMRWDYEEVDFEPGGKEHSTVGGSYDTGKRIVKEVWGRKPPTYAEYNFISLKGGPGKMSSSAGDVVTVSDILKVYTPSLTRFLFTGSRPNAEFTVAFDTEVLQVYDDFNRAERIYFGEEQGRSEKEEVHLKRVYELSMPDPEEIPEKRPVQPGLRHLTNLVQIFPDDIERVYGYFEDEIETEFDRERLIQRSECALNWVREYAPESFRFSIQEEVPEDVKEDLDEEEREALLALAESLEQEWNDDEELFNEFYNICEEVGINNKNFFQAAYKVLIGKTRGPKLATLVMEMGPANARDILCQIE